MHDTLDGNPLIYALKGLHGYTTDRATILALLQCAYAILPLALPGLPCDAIVPIPSSSPLVGFVARRVSRDMGIPVFSCLEKRTIRQLLDSAPPIDKVETRYQGDYKRLLADLSRQAPGALFKLKSVDTPLRRYLSPVVATPAAAALSTKRVLLIDDLVGSGTSLSVAADELRAQNVVVTQALTLLSRL